MLEERKQVDIDRQDLAPLELNSINTIATEESHSHVTLFFIRSSDASETNTFLTSRAENKQSHNTHGHSVAESYSRRQCRAAFLPATIICSLVSTDYSISTRYVIG